MWHLHQIHTFNNNLNEEGMITSHLIYANFPANICWFWRRLEDVFSVTIFRLPRHLQDVLRDVFKMSPRCLQEVFARCLEDVLEDEKLLHWRRIEDVLKTCLEDVLKTCLEDVCKASWRPTKCFLELSVSDKSKCVSNKSGISQIYIWRIYGESKIHI